MGEPTIVRRWSVLTTLSLACQWPSFPDLEAENWGSTATSLDQGDACGWTEITLPPEEPDSGGPDDPWPTDPDDSDADSDPPPTDPLPLLITEFLADPEGRDGAVGHPEFVEILNVGAEPIALAHIGLRARGWSTITSIEASSILPPTLAPGGILVFEWYADTDLFAPPHQNGTAWIVSVPGGTGLRNRDGGILVESTFGVSSDLVQYGAAQSSPFDDPVQWMGTPVEAGQVGQSACRDPSSPDSNRATDWMSCAPTPGHADPPAPPPEPPEPPPPEPPPPEPPEPPPPDPPPIPPDAIAIVGVLANPVGIAADENLLEYVEIINLGDQPVDLADVTIADDPTVGAPGTDPLLYREGLGGCAPSTCLAPGFRALVVGSVYAGPVGDALVLVTDDSTIADGGLTTSEPVVLRRADGEMLSSYRVWEDPLAEPYPRTMEVPVVRVDPLGPDIPANWDYGTQSPAPPGP